MKQGLMLWVFVFAGPLAWFVDLEANLAFSIQICSGPWSYAPAVVSLLAVVVTATAGMLSWTRFRQMRQTEPATPKVYQIVAIAGAMLSAAFVVVIIAESIPVMMLQNCR